MHEAGKAWGVVSDLRLIWEICYRQLRGVSDQMPVIPGSGAYVQSTLMGLGAGGQAYQEAINSGYVRKQQEFTAELSLLPKLHLKNFSAV